MADNFSKVILKSAASAAVDVLADKMAERGMSLPEIMPTTDAEKVLIAGAIEQALAVINGADPVSASSAFVMAATAYRAAVADWNAAKAAHPAKD